MDKPDFAEWSAHFLQQDKNELIEQVVRLKQENQQLKDQLSGVCEWKKTIKPVVGLYYVTGCKGVVNTGGREVVDDECKYCLYCGKKINEVKK